MTDPHLRVSQAAGLLGLLLCLGLGPSLAQEGPRFDGLSPEELVARFESEVADPDGEPSEVLEELARRGPKAAPVLERLVDVLEADAEADFVSDIVEICRAVGGPAIPHLLRIGEHANEDAQSEAISTLATLAKEKPALRARIVPELVKSLRSESLGDTASYGLTEIGEETLPYVLDVLGDARARPEALEVIRSVAPVGSANEVIKRLLPLAKKTRGDDKRDVLVTLEAMLEDLRYVHADVPQDEAIAKYCLELLDDPKLRFEAAALAVYLHCPKRLLDRLVAVATSDPAPAVRGVSAFAAGEDPRLRDFLLKNLNAKLEGANPATERWYRLMLLQAVGRSGEVDPKLAKELAQVARSPDHEACVVRTLGVARIHSAASVVPILRRALDSSNGSTRQDAIRGLNRLGAAAKPALDAVLGLIQVHPVHLDEARPLLTRFPGPDVVSALEELLGHHEPLVRADAAGCLLDQDVGNVKALGLFRAALREQQPITLAAARELSGHGLDLERSLEVLQRHLLMDDHVWIQIEAVRGLGQLGARAKSAGSAIGKVGKRADRDELHLRRAVREALLRIEPARGRELLLSGLRDPDPEERWFAWEILREHSGAPTNADVWVEALACKSMEVRLLALRAAAEKGLLPKAKLRGALADSHWRIRLEAIRLLGSDLQPAASKRLSADPHEDVRAAAKALGK